MATWRKVVAVLGGVAVFVFMVGVMRIMNWVPIVTSLTVWLGLTLALMPVRKPKQVRKSPRKPEEMTEEERAIADFNNAARRLRRLAEQAQPADVPLFDRLADLVQTLRDHHRVNPEHADLTRVFRKHVLTRMVDSVGDYVTLAKRAGPDMQDRLSDVSRQLESYVPALEKIDKACLENDLTALEINVDVLNEQLGKRR